MTDIAIQGIYGRMGRALIEKIAARQDCRVVAGVDREAGKVGDIPVYAGFEGLPKVDAINAEAGNSYEYVYDRSQVRQKRGAKELGISSVRGGGIVGEHDVLFCGPEEVLTLSHSAGSRGVFADGAVQAALYVAGREPGYYTMTDLLRGKLPCV